MKPLSKIVKKIHLYLGLSCGILVSISGLTGAMYVWQPELAAALNPKLLQVESIGMVSEETLLKTAFALYEKHQDSVVKLFLPYREQQTISVVYTNGRTLYYHPENGMVLGQKSASISFFENLLNIHRTLGVPKVGKYIVGGSAVLFSLFLLTSGLFLWWKKYRSNFGKGVKIKWKRNKKKLNYDIHKTLGILFLVPLTFMAFSGGYFTYNTYYKKGFTVMDGFAANSKLDTLLQENDHFSVKTLLNNPDENYALRAIYFPENSTGTYQFRYIKERKVVPGLRKTKELKLGNNGVISSTTSFESDLLSAQIVAQMYPIHTGEITGLLGRILVFISGFVPVILFITGFRYYYFRTYKKNNGKKERKN
ncbi:PepSY-associated TM helix domain-containing protein [Gelidibacter salicanalis]|uniref:PepSY domain-containing protein n=1 Tax=Gelidibacter salicanalis TaxID=291193 RepID=A0A934KMT8_9FLAO|nr:PepSY-associated TM helix domain-containing protein [Gelidibacter salicanalis]MBJ7880624.1 PepSY domain-containing protein [Gelidibacter salicanalis]